MGSQVQSLSRPPFGPLRNFFKKSGTNFYPVCWYQQRRDDPVISYHLFHPASCIFRPFQAAHSGKAGVTCPAQARQPIPISKNAKPPISRKATKNAAYRIRKRRPAHGPQSIRKTAAVISRVPVAAKRMGTNQPVPAGALLIVAEHINRAVAEHINRAVAEHANNVVAEHTNYVGTAIKPWQCAAMRAAKGRKKLPDIFRHRKNIFPYIPPHRSTCNGCSACAKMIF